MANMTLEEALGISALADEGESIHVDINTRQVTVPSGELLFGVESDENVEIKHIVIDGRYIDGTDLSEFVFRVNYQNANGDKSTYLVRDITTGEDSIEFDWVVSREVTSHAGTISFIVCAYTLKGDRSIDQEWNSTLGSGNVLNGLEVGVADIGDYIVDELKNILYEVIANADQAKEFADTAAGYAGAAKTAASTATSARDDAQAAQKAASDSAAEANTSQGNAKGYADQAKEFADTAAGYAGAATFSIGYDSSGMLTLFMNNPEGKE